MAHDFNDHEMSGRPDDAAPSDNTTLVDVLDSYRNTGFGTSFGVEPGATVRCDGCQSVLDGARLPMLSSRRLEGASDPSDMMMVVATSCPVCGAEGTMVLGYGPMASQDDAAVLAAIRDLRGVVHQLPSDAAPDELPEQNAG